MNTALHGVQRPTLWQVAVHNEEGQRTAGRTVQVALNAARLSIVAGCDTDWHKQTAHAKFKA